MTVAAMRVFQCWSDKTVLHLIPYLHNDGRGREHGGKKIKNQKYGVLSPPPRRTRDLPACLCQKPAGVITPRGGETTVGARAL